MTNSELTKTLPPLLLGFGALIPVLVIYGQGTLTKADRALGGTIFVLVTWIAYFVTGFLWGIWFYDSYVILSLLVIAAFLLVICIVWRSFTKAPNSNNIGIAILFLAATAVLAFASAVYVEPSGHDVIHLRGLRADLKTVDGLFTGERETRALQFVTRFGCTAVVLSKDRFKELETLSLTYRDGSKSPPLSAAHAVPVLGPYLGNQYVLKMEP